MGVGPEDGEPGEWTMTLDRGEFTGMGTLTQDLEFNILTRLNGLLIGKAPQGLDLRMFYGKKVEEQECLWHNID